MNDSCGCCEGLGQITPLTTVNRPGLNALVYRAGSHATFLATMKARLSGLCLKVPVKEGRSDDTQQIYPLRNLTTRADSDPAIALLDAWATVADVLTFYQERIANEGYLRTATERRSILELGRLVGYTLRPGVAASVYLAFMLDNNYEQVEIPVGACVQSLPNPGELPQSFEIADKLEASANWNQLKPRLTRPQKISNDTDPQTLNFKGITTNLKPNDPLLIEFDNQQKVYRILNVEADPANARTAVTVQPWQDSLSSSGLASTAEPDNPNTTSTSDVVIKLLETLPDTTLPPKNSLSLQRDLGTSFADNSDTSLQLLLNLQPNLEASTLSTALDNAALIKPSVVKVHALRTQASVFGNNAPPLPIFDKDKGRITGYEEWSLTKTADVTTESFELTVWWRASDYYYGNYYGSYYDAPDGTIQTTIKIGEQEFSPDAPRPLRNETFHINLGADQESVAVTVTEVQSETPGTFRLEFVFKKLPIKVQINHNQAQLQVASEGSNPTTVTRVAGELIPITTGSLSQTGGIGVQLLRGEILDEEIIELIEENQFKISVSGSVEKSFTPLLTEQPKIVSLDAPYKGILPGSWVVLEKPSVNNNQQKTVKVSKVRQVSEASRADYGIVAKGTQIQLDQDWLNPQQDSFAVIRGTTVYAQSELLDMAEEPLDPTQEAVCGKYIELDTLAGGLVSGRWLIVTGERTDIPSVSGVKASELVMLAAVEQSSQPNLPGDKIHSKLWLANDLAYCYKRDTVTIYGNVVRATHGETRNEPLGSGDGSKALQQFTLRQPPLTYLAAPKPAGTETTLEVRVNDILWHETDSLAELGPSDRCYITRTDDESKTTIIFGNGQQGARLPSGVENVKAFYRNGIGKVGNVKAEQINLLATRPLGVRSVINPLRASGGADRESRDQARRNAPLAVTALDRLVSLQDYADFARTFAGIGKASVARLSNGRRQLVHLTVAGADDIPIDKHSDLYRNLLQALQQFGDPQQPIQVDIRELVLLIIQAKVRLLPDYLWEAVVLQIRETLQNTFSFERRELGQDVLLSGVISTIQQVPGVDYVDVETFGSIPEKDPNSGNVLTPEEIVNKVKEQMNKIPSRIPVNLAEFQAGALRAAQLAYLTPAVKDTLILTELTV